MILCSRWLFLTDRLSVHAWIFGRVWLDLMERVEKLFLISFFFCWLLLVLVSFRSLTFISYSYNPSSPLCLQEEMILLISWSESFIPQFESTLTICKSCRCMCLKCCSRETRRMWCVWFRFPFPCMLPRFLRHSWWSLGMHLMLVCTSLVINDHEFADRCYDLKRSESTSCMWESESVLWRSRLFVQIEMGICMHCHSLVIPILVSLFLSLLIFALVFLLLFFLDDASKSEW